MLHPPWSREPERMEWNMEDWEDDGGDDPPPDPRIGRIAGQLARLLLATAAASTRGPAPLQSVLRRAVGRRESWMAPLVEQVRARGLLDPARELALQEAIAAFAPFREACSGAGPLPHPRLWLPFHPTMAPPAAPVGWLRPPALPTVGDLAGWLSLTPGELDWFADLTGRNDAAPEALRHYRHRWLPKRRGGYRLLEIPKPRLKDIQRRILRDILAPVPVHHAAHGCVPGRSVLTHALPHCDRRVLLRIDLRGFFPSVSGGRVRAVFESLGYPRRVATVLAALTTHRLPRRVAAAVPVAEGTPPEQARRLRRDALTLCRPHLPQGAPTSPALANLCAFRLDLRLSGAARLCGATYTRYVDDLHFSGDEGFAAGLAGFRRLATSILEEEGFAPNERKTRVMPAARAQIAAGVVVNRHPNIRWVEYDTLKAILTNCGRHGAASQNRAGVDDFRAHLMGRIAHVAHLNPDRGARLQALFDAVDWS